ncbi:MAG TPA: hypothetical protein PLW02_08565 [Verrucomicrobiota bacterium]|nr:hypothetical protein [Verrucomicrobiota bacterium]
MQRIEENNCQQIEDLNQRRMWMANFVFSDSVKQMRSFSERLVQQREFEYRAVRRRFLEFYPNLIKP